MSLIFSGIDYRVKEVKNDEVVAYYYDVTEYVKHIFGDGVIREAWCYIDCMSKKAYDKDKSRRNKLKEIINCCQIIDEKMNETGIFSFSVYNRLEVEMINGNKFCINMRTTASHSGFGYVELMKGKKNSYEEDVL